jgi:hypothetical protein
MAATLPSNSIHHKHLQNMRKSTILIPEESKSKWEAVSAIEIVAIASLKSILFLDLEYYCTYLL